MIQDIRYALRTLRKSSGFALTSVIVLSLAIGANTAMFSVLNGVLFAPLPYPSPEQLAMLWLERPAENLREGRSSFWNVEQWRGQSKSFADIAAYDPGTAILTRADESERINVMRITPNAFALFGIRPLQGRTFSSEEADQRQRVALISEQLWRTRFGGSTSAIGSTIELNGTPSLVIGVLPSAEFPPLGVDAWEPHTLLPDWDTARTARGVGGWFVVGRVQPRTTLKQAQAEMDAIARQLDEQLPPADRNRGISVVPLSQQLTRPQTRLALWMLMGAVFCVLLIAATNVASLSLARSAGRIKEIIVRTALGASRTRIVRQLLVESLTLAIVSGAVGLLVAAAGIRLILAFRPAGLARFNDIGLDPAVLAVALSVCLLTGILVGLAPAILMSRQDLASSGREGGRSIAGGVAVRAIRRALVVTEFALAIMLLVGAGLLIRSLWSLEKIDPGFRPERVLSVNLALPEFRGNLSRVDFYTRVLEQVESLPGVESAGIIGDIFVGATPERILTSERNENAMTQRLRFRVDEVSDDFFNAVGTPLRRGRFFSIEDRPDSPRVAIINEAMAQRLWPGRDPVGERFKLGPADSRNPWVTVVGVVADMRRQGLENAPIPQMFEPLAQNPSRLAMLLVKTSMDDPLKLGEPVRTAVRRVEKYALAYGVTTLEQRLGLFLTERQFQSSLLIGFSLVAMLMAVVGIYGLMQYSIATRTREIGIRIAVGARAGQIFRMVIREGLTLSLTGLLLGLLGALWLGRAGSSLLFGVSATDPLTFVTVSLMLIAAAAAACYFPARRAMKVAPIEALRQD